MEVVRPGVQSQLWLPAYITATATSDESSICDLHHSSWQSWILKPLSEARDWTWNLMVPSWIHFCCAMMVNPKLVLKSVGLFLVFFCCCCFLFFFFCFSGPHLWHMVVHWLGTESELQQCGTQAASVTYTTAHGNSGSPIHWLRPGIKPTSSWILAGFASAAPQQELTVSVF